MIASKNMDALTTEFRNFLQEVARAKMLEMSENPTSGMISGKVLKIAANHTCISESSLQGMVYSGTGGLDSWVKLFAYLFNLSPKQLTRFLVEIKELLKTKRKISEGETRWSQLGDQLTEDKLLFWGDAIEIMENASPEYQIISKQKKKE